MQLVILDSLILLPHSIYHWETEAGGQKTGQCHERSNGNMCLGTDAHDAVLYPAPTPSPGTTQWALGVNLSCSSAPHPSHRAQQILGHLSPCCPVQRLALLFSSLCTRSNVVYCPREKRAWQAAVLGSSLGSATPPLCAPSWTKWWQGQHLLS